MPSSKLTNQQETSFLDLPEIPTGKSRVVLVFDQSPVSWKLFPMVVTVDHRLALEIKSIRTFAVVDVEPGLREIRFAWGPDATYLKPLALEIKPGATGYFSCNGVGGYPDVPKIGKPRGTVRIHSLTLPEAVRLLGQSQESPSF